MPTALESAIVMAVLTVVTGAACLRDRVPRRAPSSARAWVVWLGLADALNVLLFFAAYKLTIAVSVLAHYLTPVFVAIAAPLVLRERMTARTALAVALSFGGLAIMLVPSDGTSPGKALWASAALGAGSAVFYATNFIVNKFVIDAFSTSEVMFWHGVVATPFLAAFVPRAAWAAVEPRAVAFLAVVAIGPGALAGLAFVWGLRRMPAAHASTLTLLEPLVSVLLGAAVLGEPLGSSALFGGLAILAGAILVMTQSQPRARPEASASTAGRKATAAKTQVTSPHTARCPNDDSA
jgi:drug/metabolite transporter (DMT)-like permease